MAGSRIAVLFYFRVIVVVFVVVIRRLVCKEAIELVRDSKDGEDRHTLLTMCVNEKRVGFVAFLLTYYYAKLVAYAYENDT